MAWVYEIQFTGEINTSQEGEGPHYYNLFYISVFQKIVLSCDVNLNVSLKL